MGVERKRNGNCETKKGEQCENYVSHVVCVISGIYV